MDEIGCFVDGRQKSWCIHCGALLASVVRNRDHVPSRCLLIEPFPENLPVVEVCKECNDGFSRDEEYLIAFLGSVLAGSANPIDQTIPKARDVLQRSPGLKTRIEQSRTVVSAVGGPTQVLWEPERDRINRILLKNARGHAYFEIGEPMLREPTRIWSAPIPTLTSQQLDEFESINMGSVWPEVGSRMMTRLITGQDMRGSWVVVQCGNYRYAVAFQGNLVLVRSVVLEYLATEVAWADPAS